MGQLALNGRSKKFKQGVFKPKHPEKFFGKEADKRRKLYNGMIKCQLFMYFK